MNNLRAYIHNEIDLEQLRSRLTGAERFEIRNGRPAWKRTGRRPAAPCAGRARTLRQRVADTARQVRRTGRGPWLRQRLRAIRGLQFTDCQRAARYKALLAELQQLQTATRKDHTP